MAGGSSCGGACEFGRARARRPWRRPDALPFVVATALLHALDFYTLILHAFQSSKVGYVVAARECSIVFSTLVGTLWFREGPVRTRLGAAAIILAGVACVAVAR